ncbi:MAG: MBL fold metallo-hydrolase [Phycisphaerae bacterium]|nr:MBL fold metallo-hydrolase [Phycisphaerae bacterium]
MVKRLAITVLAENTVIRGGLLAEHGLALWVESLDWLASRVGRIFSTRANPVELSAGVWLTGQIPRHHDCEDTGGSFFLDESLTELDAIIDDQALYVKTGNGIVVLLGCAHAGVANTLDHVCASTGEDRIHAVLGGMHLLNANERRLDRTSQRLRDLAVQRIGLAHCTGFGPMVRLYQELPYRCFQCASGMRVQFE